MIPRLSQPADFMFHNGCGGLVSGHHLDRPQGQWLHAGTLSVTGPIPPEAAPPQIYPTKDTAADAFKLAANVQLPARWRADVDK